MELTEKYQNLLSFFNPKEFEHKELAKTIDNIITKIKEKGGEHQAACSWTVLLLYKNNKINLNEVDKIIDEFNEYCNNNYNIYIDSLSHDFNNGADLTFYNAFLNKKRKEN